MLVITRKDQDSITIGKDIEIKVLQIKGKQVRIGILAPSDMEIDRKENKNDRG